MKHYVLVPFRGVGIDLRDDEWFRARIEIFKKYTLNSLLNQTNKNFILWITFRPEDEENPLVTELDYYLRAINVPHVFTFHGLPYWDDKYGGNLWQRAKNIARIVRFCWRTGKWNQLLKSVRLVLVDKNGDLVDRVGKSLISLQYMEEDQQDTVLLTRIDSDDMFRKDAIDEIQVWSKEPWEALGMTNGYLYNVETGEVAEWIPRTNPPFHTIRFVNGTFWDGQKHVARYGDYKSHEDVPKVFNTEKLVDPFYCVTTRNPRLHISTTWNHPFRGKIVDKAVLKDFGL